MLRTGTACALLAAQAAATQIWPEEGDRHTRTWMGWASSQSIWGSTLLPIAQEDLANVAKIIGKYEPVSVMVPAAAMSRAQSLLGSASGVTLVQGESDDMWMRDTGPLFVEKDQAGTKSLVAVKFNFNGWGNKPQWSQPFSKDAKVADFVASHVGVPLVTSSIVLEGGGLEVDGEGTAIATESCIINPNRNPGKTKAQIEQELRTQLGITKVIWLPGIAGKEITDGHTDFYARFTGPAKVFAHLDTDPASYDKAVTEQHLAILQAATDAKGRALQVTTLEAPHSIPSAFSAYANDYAAGYVNYYVGNGFVIMPKFGDAVRDDAAKTKMQSAYPGRTVEQIFINGIASGGGGIHCTTQQQAYVLEGAGGLAPSLLAAVVAAAIAHVSVC
eukprot:TRINITY_DN4700_c0_g1_i2.p1 TRINITY_DN4700_c0_g1~~TRINITY_DN4700_c0_g1_i2.p1  ORF type:complete len:413 (+),score=134.09 TRINITY_DN4700_c0_g1_i2:77-1240(+)